MRYETYSIMVRKSPNFYSLGNVRWYERHLYMLVVVDWSISEII